MNPNNDNMKIAVTYPYLYDTEFKLKSVLNEYLVNTPILAIVKYKSSNYPKILHTQKVCSLFACPYKPDMETKDLIHIKLGQKIMYSGSNSKFMYTENFVANGVEYKQLYGFTDINRNVNDSENKSSNNLIYDFVDHPIPVLIEDYKSNDYINLICPTVDYSPLVAHIRSTYKLSEDFIINLVIALPMSDQTDCGVYVIIN